MSDTQGRWLTYEELGQIIGRTPSGARMFASRRGWPRRTSNRIGARTSVLVPADIAEAPPRAAHAAERAVPANGVGERAIARAAIDALTGQLAIANRRLDDELMRSARAVERTAVEIADARQQRDDAQRRADRAEHRIEELQTALAAAQERIAALLANQRPVPPPPARRSWWPWRRAAL